MTRHFHIVAGASGGPAYAESEFKDYEDSIQKLTTLSTGMFGHLFDGENSLTLERFKHETNYGDGDPIMVGTPRLCLYWFACEKCDPMTVN